MKILVLGAGVIGMTTAYTLGHQGHEVIVIDREDAPARVTSHANGAQLAYSYMEPFAAPSTLRKLPAYMMGKDKGIHMRAAWDSAYFRWGLAFLRQCTAPQEARVLHEMLALSAQSLAAMKTIEASLPDGAINHQKHGKIILTRSQSELESYEKIADIKAGYGLPVRALSKQECLEIEPNLRVWKDEFHGGLYAKGDSVLDPAQFCTALQKASLEHYGTCYKFAHKIHNLILENGQAAGVQTDQGTFWGDAIVVCLGNGVNALLKPLKEAQNIYPLQGYSLTLPLGTNPPKTSITDPKNKLVFANLGNHMRIAGLLDTNLPAADIPARGQYLLNTAQRLWPDAADYAAPNHLWSGERPTTPSSIPIVRASKYKGLYYNIGHGSLGLTLAAGCAERIAALIDKPS